MKKVFVDTNVLIDVLTGRDGAVASQQLFAHAYLGKVCLTISSLSIVNAVYICKRYKMDVQAVLQTLRTLTSFVEVADLTRQNVVACLSAGWKDYEDSTQAFCAQENAIPYIVTRNVKDFSSSVLTVLTPEEFLPLIRN